MLFYSLNLNNNYNRTKQLILVKDTSINRDLEKSRESGNISSGLSFKIRLIFHYFTLIYYFEIHSMQIICQNNHSEIAIDLKMRNKCQLDFILGSRNGLVLYCTNTSFITSYDLLLQLFL